MKYRLLSVSVRVEVDQDADTSYLDQVWESEADNRSQAARKAAFDRGEFGFVGIRAVADIARNTPQGGYGPIQTITSGGLWGIEDDSGSDYFREVATDELSALRDELESMGVDLSRWGSLASSAVTAL